MEGNTQQWDYSIFWQEVLNQIQAQISEQEYVMWFRNLQYYASRENEIILAVPSSFYRDQVKQRYLKLIQDILFDLSGMSIQVTFEIVKLQPPADHSTGHQNSMKTQDVVDNSITEQESYTSVGAPNNKHNSIEQEKQKKVTSSSKTSKILKPGDKDYEDFGSSQKNFSSASAATGLSSTNSTNTAYSTDSTHSADKTNKDPADKDATLKPTSKLESQGANRNSGVTIGISGHQKNQNAQQNFEQHPKKPQTNSHVNQHTTHQLVTNPHMRKHNELRIDYTFENFVVGENNSFAANASIAISKNPGTAYNPCLIYGGVGLGKTHLIQSIGNYIYNNYEKSRVVYVTAETFTNEFIQAIRDGKNHQFKNRYRNVDVLLIDDIHFLQSKDQTQEELFHTFNALYDSNKQMVFTCDRPVSELKHLTDRLRSRFERGLNVDLQPPDYETRYAILKRKIEEKRAAIDEEVIELISKNITTNVRDLEAALTKLIAYSDILNKKITVDIAQEQLKDVFSSPKQSNITIEIIQRAVGEYFNLSPYDLRGKKRTKAIAFPRQIAMYITREITEYSTTEVGLEFGGRDHTTVMHACQRIESRMQTDPYLEPTIQRLIRQIKEYGTK